MLRKIAQAGLSGLSSIVNGTAPSEAEPAPPPPSGPAIASADDFPQPSGAPVSALGFAAH
jgi:hypothetical protein